MTKKVLKYAEHRGADAEDVARIEKDLDEKHLKAIYHSSGFDHPMMPVYTNLSPKNIGQFQWGILPKKVKDASLIPSIINNTLLARAETIFEVPSYRELIPTNRAIVMVDGYYEHHHINGKTIPFFIYKKNLEPIFLAGMFNVTSINNELLKTCCIITTQGNEMMTKIHNNPKADGARMPVILHKKDFEDWLSPEIRKKDDLQIFFKPYPSDELTAHPVAKIRIKENTNFEEISNEVKYKWLPLGFESIKTPSIQLSLF